MKPMPSACTHLQRRCGRCKTKSARGKWGGVSSYHTKALRSDTGEFMSCFSMSERIALVFQPFGLCRSRLVFDRWLPPPAEDVSALRALVRPHDTDSPGFAVTRANANRPLECGGTWSAIAMVSFGEIVWWGCYLQMDKTDQSVRKGQLVVLRF